MKDVRRLAQRRTSNLYDTWFTRNVSVWITAILAPLGTSPNLISVINFGVGIGGCLLVAFGGKGGVLAGVALVHLYAVLDSVDGELARLLNKRSLVGMFLEDWSAYAMVNAFPVAVALYLVSAGASPAAIVVAILFVTLGRNAMPALRRAIAESDARPSSEPLEGGRAPRAPGVMGVVENHFLHQTNIRVVLTVLIVVHVATGLRLPLEAAFHGYILALLAREAGIVFLAVRSNLVDSELARLRGRTPPAVRP